MILSSVCVVVAALYFAQDVLIPIALAMLLSFLLTPMVWRLERWRLPRTAATLIVVLIALGVVGGIGYVVYYQAVSLAEQLPTYQENIVHKFQHFRPTRNGVIDKAQQTIEKVGKELDQPATQPATQSARSTTAPTTTASTSGGIGSPQVQPDASPGTEQNPYWVFVRSQQSRFAQFSTLLSPLLSPLGKAGIVLIFTIFILVGREDLRDRVIRLFGRGQLTLTTQALDDAATRISRYLMMQSMVNGAYGITVWLGLWIIGVPNPALFGLMSGLLRFIPYIGPWLGAALPLATSLAIFPGYTQPLETLILYVIIELITNNALEPWLYGSSTGMSTLAVLVSAIFWAWLWGPVGLLLSTPLTVVLVVIGKYVPQMQFIDILLGDEPVLSPPMRVYQRLLAMDQEEAMDVLRDLRKTESLEKVYDNVLLKTLAMAETDRHNGQLDDRRQAFIRQSMRSIVEELGDEERATLADQRAAETVDAARHDASNLPVASSTIPRPRTLNRGRFMCQRTARSPWFVCPHITKPTRSST
jgi:predicted PurR-regulated permease PerM